MVGILQNKFQSLNIVSLKGIGVQVNVGEPQEKEFRRRFDGKRVAVFRRNQKHVSRTVRKLILINTLNAST